MKWKPLLAATVDHIDYGHPTNRCFVDTYMQVHGGTVEEAIAALQAYDSSCTYWMNDLYQVQMRVHHSDAFGVEMAHLNIRRRDGASIFDWRHRQLIKNQLVGEECEGFELYPAESRLVDTSNKYHIWCFTDPTFRIGVGIDYRGRDVVAHEVKSPPGMRQRRVL